MNVLEYDGFRKLRLVFDGKPDRIQLLNAWQAAYAFQTTHSSYAPFQALIRDALGRLRTIDDPYVIALSSYYRFDDACGDDDWRAVQIGSYRLSNGNYFSRGPGPDHPNHAAGQLASAVLDDLEAGDWRGLFRDINGLDRADGYYPREFGLLRKDGGEYLVLGDSVNGDSYGGIFRIHDMQDFEFVGYPRDHDEDGYVGEVDERLDTGKPIEWTDLSEWADGYLENWDQGQLRQERERLRLATLELPDPIRSAALAYLADDNPLAAEKLVSDALGFGRWSEARAWTGAVRGGPGVGLASPSYLQDACEFVRAGDLAAAIPLLMENGNLSEREARNWVETYIDHLALTTSPDRGGGFRELLSRIFLRWRR